MGQAASYRVQGSELAAPAVVTARLPEGPTTLLDAAASTAVSADAAGGVHIWQRGSQGIRCASVLVPILPETWGSFA